MWKLVRWYNENKQLATEAVKTFNRFMPLVNEDRFWGGRAHICEHFENDECLYNSFHIKRVNPSNDPNDLAKTVWEYEVSLMLQFLDVEFLLPIGIFEYKEKK